MNKKGILSTEEGLAMAVAIKNKGKGKAPMSADKSTSVLRTFLLIVFMVLIGFVMGYYVASKDGWEQFERGANAVIVYHRDGDEGTYPAPGLRQLIYDSGINPQSIMDIERIKEQAMRGNRRTRQQ